MRLPSAALVRLLGVSLVLALAGGCTRRETAVQRATAEKMLLLGNAAEPRDLDPHIVDAATDMNILVALFEGLTVFDEATMAPLPGVAERWDISADGLVYTFHLRPTARWSDGHPLTAGDFAYSFRRILTPALGAQYSYMLYAIRNAEAFNAGRITDFGAVGVAALDDQTLRITLERPTPYLLALAAHGTWLPVDRRTIEKSGRLEQRDSGWTRAGRLVGNGPFVLQEWTPNARIVVRRNPHYWDNARNHLEGVTFFPIATGDIEERDFRAGQLHVTWDMPSTKIAAYRQHQPSALRLKPQLNLIYFNFNVHRAPFDNPKVRRALSLSIDRAALADRVMNGALVACGTFVPPHCGEYVSPPGVPTDFAAARRLLAEAGYPGGRGLPKLPVVILNDLRSPKITEAQQAIWQRELGVSISIEPSEQKTWLETQRSMNHTLGYLAWVADYPDPYTYLSLGLTGNGNNWSGFSDPTYDEMVRKAQDTRDPAARFALLREAEARLLEASPVAPIGVITRSYLVTPEVKNYRPSPLGFQRYQLVELANP